ncbi:MAG: LuxR C-terminal-related transcriptional regulator [Deltaproteobacteria bacterium]|nr:LuxR C-terminal-related transcriptional regulator [Deltaproteobacteria bacterium]
MQTTNIEKQAATAVPCVQEGAIADFLVAPEEQTESLWSLLLAGHCRVIDRGVADDKSHFLVVKSVAPHERSRFRLNRLECEMVHSAVTGLPLKVIAADLQISTSTATHRLHQALAKLGCASRVELIWLHATLVK